MEHLKYRITQSRLLYVMTIPGDLSYMGKVKVGEVIVDNEVADDGDMGRLIKAVVKSLKGRKFMRDFPQFHLDYVECTTFNDTLQYKAQDVHDVLTNSGVDKELLHGEHDIWFNTDLDTVKRAIAVAKRAVEAKKQGKKPPLTYNGTDSQVKPRQIKFRPEQQRAIDETVHSFGLRKAENHAYLWDAKMRFGKTLSGLEVARRMGYASTLIVTHRPVVDDGWYADFLKIFGNDNQYIYASRMDYKEEEQNGNAKQCMRNVDMNGFGMLRSAIAGGKKKVIFFVSMQYLRLSTLVGGKDQDPLKRAIMNYDWQLVMIDEAHEGTESMMGKRVIEKLTKEETRILSLSGTPFNLLDKFDNSQIYTWDYVMEQKAKQQWDDENYGDPNPYADLPRMQILTFTMNEMLRGKVEGMSGTFTFHDFFRVYTGDKKEDKCVMPSPEHKGKFIFEDKVKAWLDRLVEESATSQYPFSTEEFQDKFRHTFWLLPGVKEAKALEELLHKHEVFNDDNFKIVNVAGDGNIEDKGGKALKAVQKAIRENERTITLSCGKLTTGVSVPEWTAVLNMKGSENTPAATYMQTIFRVQTHATLDGRMKSDCYVFDFAPDRALTAVAETAKMQVIAAGGKKSQQLKLSQKDEEEQLTAFLQLCPVISMDGATMGHHFSANQLFEKLKNVYVERAVRSGYADNSIYNVEGLMDLNDEQKKVLGDVHDLLGSMPNLWKPSKIDVTNNGLTDKEREDAEQGDKNDKNNNPKTKEQIEAQKKREEENKEKRARISVMRGIAIRIPLLVYGAEIDDDKEELTIDNFTDDHIIDDESWKEFMPKGITKEIFRVLAPLFDRAIFTGAAKRIREMVKAADDLTIEERIAHIAKIFSYFHNPDKETVLTPWRVVNMHLSDTIGGWCFFNKEFDGDYTEKNEYDEDVATVRPVDHGDVTTNIFADYHTRVLEINSKTGLYPLYMAYSIFKTTKEKAFRQIELTDERNKKGGNYDKQAKDDQVIWDEVLMENIFVVCRTHMAVSITNRTLRGFRKNVQTNVKCYERKLEISDLVDANILKKKNEYTARGEKHKVCDMIEVLRVKPELFIADIVQGRDFWHVSNSITMKPNEDINKIKFSVVVGNPPYQIMDGGAGASATPIYNLFVNAAIELNPSFISMITPSRWFAGGKGLDTYRESMRKDKRLRKLFNFTNGKDCFPTSSTGSINYFLWQENYNDDCEFHTLYNGRDDVAVRPLDEFNIVIANNKAISIIHKIQSKKERSFAESVKPYKPFGLRSYVRGEEDPFFGCVSLFSSAGVSYIKRTDITACLDIVDHYKIMTSKLLAEHAGEPDKTGRYRVLSRTEIIKPNEICTESYLILASSPSITQIKNCLSYCSTKFFRFLLLQFMSSINMTKEVFAFVPMQDFSEPWSDEKLYKKYGLKEDEIAYIEAMIKPME